jgi:hypothetical protein
MNNFEMPERSMEVEEVLDIPTNSIAEDMAIIEAEGLFEIPHIKPLVRDLRNPL